MLIRIHKNLDEDMAVLLDWKLLEPLWLRSMFAPVDRSKLINAYSELWFDKKSSPWSFVLGDIFFSQNEHGEQELRFSNGRNRTNLIIKHQNLVPVCIFGEIPNVAEIESAIVKVLDEGDTVKIPDLPIYPMSKLGEMVLSAGYSANCSH